MRGPDRQLSWQTPPQESTLCSPWWSGLCDGGHHHNVTRWANGVAALGRANVVTESPHLVCLLLPRGSTSSRSTWALPFALLAAWHRMSTPAPAPAPTPTRGNLPSRPAPSTTVPLRPLTLSLSPPTLDRLVDCSSAQVLAAAQDKLGNPCPPPPPPNENSLLVDRNMNLLVLFLHLHRAMPLLL